MKLSGWILLIATVAAVLFLHLSREWEQSASRNHGIGHATAYTYNDLRSVSGAVIIYCTVEKKKLVNLEDGRTTRLLNGKELYASLSNSTLATPNSYQHENWTDRQAVCDAWGNEVHALFRLIAGELHVRIWSMVQTCAMILLGMTMWFMNSSLSTHHKAR